MVGVAGFEPAAHWSPNQLRYQTALHPDIKFFGRGQKDSNLDTWFWRPLLYQLSYTPCMAEKMGFEPMRPVIEPNGLANRPLQPLEYFSRLITYYGGEGGIRTHTAPFGVTGFQDQLLKPLGHLSMSDTCKIAAVFLLVTHRRFELRTP